jgi:hypothetical protein
MSSVLRRRPVRSISRRARLCLEALEDRATPAVLFVNTLKEGIDHTDCRLSLREAIEAVNLQSLSKLQGTELGQVSTAQGALGSNDTIEFQVKGTIYLGSQLTLSQDVTIQGPGSTLLTLSGQGLYQVFVV